MIGDRHKARERGMKPTTVTSCWSATHRWATRRSVFRAAFRAGGPAIGGTGRLNRALGFASVMPAEFIRRYNEDVLGVLRAEDVVEQLLDLAGGRIPALPCWEDPEPGPCWCQRALVSVW